MDTIKKNIWSIVCGVVAILAVISTFYPLNGKFDELKGKLDASVGDNSKLHQLNNLNPNMPVVDPKTSQVKPLGQFPTEKVIEKGKQVVGKVHSESEKLQNKALAMNERRPLVDNVFPKGGLALNDFKRQYYAALEKMKEDLDSTTVPTSEDIKKREDEVFAKEFAPLINKFGDQEQNRDAVNKIFDDFKLTLPRDMRVERAKSHAMYIMADRQGGVVGQTPSFDYHPGIPSLDDNKPPDVVDVWAAQLGLWIQQDVVNAIAETNKSTVQSGKPTVEDSIVKRLNKTDIPKVYITKNGPVAINLAQNPANLVAQQSLPGALPDDPNAPPTKTFGYSATGRVCNKDYDVMHFTIQVDADAQRFQTFMNNLTKGKFITILRVVMQGVDRQRIEQNAGYYYGKAPVVRLELKCETVFFRSLTANPDHPMMPINVQKLLKIPQTPGSVASR